MSGIGRPRNDREFNKLQVICPSRHNYYLPLCRDTPFNIKMTTNSFRLVYLTKKKYFFHNNRLLIKETLENLK